jgi:hypothetical protein
MNLVRNIKTNQYVEYIVWLYRPLYNCYNFIVRRRISEMVVVAIDYAALSLEHVGSASFSVHISAPNVSVDE